MEKLEDYQTIIKAQLNNEIGYYYSFYGVFPVNPYESTRYLTKERAEEVLQELKDGFAYLEKEKQPILSIVDFQTEYTNYLNNQKNN